MRMRKKKNLEARMEACAALWVKDPRQLRGHWREKKPDACGLRLELGCGKGRFTAETAAAHPEDLYVAVERVPDAMVIAMERCRDLGLSNVFFIDGDAAELDRYFAPDEVDLIYINFCDPWPSVKHARRRLTYESFLRGYRKILRDGGRIEFKTDNRDLFEWSLFQFPKAGFDLSEVTRNLHEHGIQGIMTDYEEKFHALGTPINRCVGTKAALPDVPVVEGLRRRLPDFEIREVGEADLGPVLALLERRPDYFALDGSAPTWTACAPTWPPCPPGVRRSRSTTRPSGGTGSRRRCWTGWRATPGSRRCGSACSWWTVRCPAGAWGSGSCPPCPERPMTAAWTACGWPAWRATRGATASGRRWASGICGTGSPPTAGR